MDRNREPITRTPSPDENKSGNSIPSPPKSENPIPSSTSPAECSSHKEFSHPQPSGSARNIVQNGGGLPGSLLPHNTVGNTTTESVGEVQQVSRFAFLLPPQRLTESNESNLGANARRERRERRERINGRWSAASRDSYERRERINDRWSAASRDSYDRGDDNSIDAITQMLLAVERFEQRGQFDYQELIMRETNLLLNGLHFHDEHSDMRMDIDNMSYEELLALEENIGYVSTALSKDDITKCVKKRLYRSNCSQNADKCSICQDEFEEGDEVGKLRCKHQYHVNCIKQWLNTKNWCPVCKSPLNSN